MSNLLCQNGLFIFEVSYLVDVYQKTLFDTIYHERSYHSVTPLVDFLKSKDMELIDVSKVNTHGGSIRCVIKNVSTQDRQNLQSENLLNLKKFEF